MDLEVKPEGITRKDVKLSPPLPGGTTIIMQRHEEYTRDKSDKNAGSLTSEGALRARQQSHDAMVGLLEQMTQTERDQVSVMVFASPTQYEGKGRRSMETASETIDGIKKAFQEGDVPEFRLLNSQERFPFKGGPIPSETIVEPKIFEKNPDFVEWLADIHGGVNKDFWIAYENDVGKVHEQRVKEGAEGPMDMANRLDHFLKAMELFSNKFHKKNPGRRLILWTVSHYDTISPYVKTRIGSKISDFLPVEYGGGFAINIDPEKHVSATIGEKKYPLSFKELNKRVS